MHWCLLVRISAAVTMTSNQRRQPIRDAQWWACVWRRTWSCCCGRWHCCRTPSDCGCGSDEPVSKTIISQSLMSYHNKLSNITEVETATREINMHWVNSLHNEQLSESYQSWYESFSERPTKSKAGDSNSGILLPVFVFQAKNTLQLSTKVGSLWAALGEGIHTYFVSWSQQCHP